MRTGQTSFLVFISKVVTSVLGFVATIYFAQILGAEILGYYALVLTLSSWIGIVGDLGVGSAVTKRMSEGENPDAYFTSGVVIAIVLSAAASLGVVVFQGPINDYIGRELALFIIILVVLNTTGSILTSALEGDRLVHISGITSPLRTGSRAIVQVGLVFLGFELGGMLVGYAVGATLVILVALYYIPSSIERPNRHHFESIWNYAKFSWLGNIRGRTFNDLDIVVLGVFVRPELVGIYSVSWGITNFIGVFGSSIEQTTFPELSQADAQDERKQFRNLFADSIAFTGLFAIPGFFGTLVIADRLLLVYGTTFSKGTIVLVVLMLATLLWDYYNQFLVGLNALDRPDIAFRINALFVVLNVVLNVALVVLYGWIGAAVATALSAGIGLTLAFLSLYRLVNFDIPHRELGNQLFAAVVMAGLVGGTRRVIETNTTALPNIAIVLTLVSLGAGVYFLALLGISSRFRSTVENNAPVSFF